MIVNEGVAQVNYLRIGKVITSPSHKKNQRPFGLSCVVNAAVLNQENR